MSKFGQLCRNLVGKYFMSKFDRQIFYVELRPVNNFHWTQLNNSPAAGFQISRASLACLAWLGVRFFRVRLEVEIIPARYFIVLLVIYVINTNIFALIFIQNYYY